MCDRDLAKHFLLFSIEFSFSHPRTSLHLAGALTEPEVCFSQNWETWPWPTEAAGVGNLCFQQADVTRSQLSLLEATLQVPYFFLLQWL